MSARPAPSRFGSDTEHPLYRAGQEAGFNEGYGAGAKRGYDLGLKQGERHDGPVPLLVGLFLGALGGGSLVGLLVWLWA